MSQDKSRINIDIQQLVELLWADRRKFSIYCIIAGVIGVVFAFSIPRVYKSQVMLAPEEMQGGLNGKMSSLASMVGLDMKLGTSDAIYPEIYPDMMHSTSFLVSLFDIKVTSKDGGLETTLKDYLKNHQKAPWFLWPVNWITKKLKGDDSSFSASKSTKTDPFWLSKGEDEIAKAIDGSITCLVDKKTNVITITAKAQDPLIARTITDSSRAVLQEFITIYRTKKARQDYEYMQKICKEAEAQYIKSRQKYAAYSDANQELLLQSAKSIQDELENDMQLKYNIYTQVVEQMQLAQAKVMERTPAFTIIQNSTVPSRHSNMPKIYILAIFIFLGAALRTTMILTKNIRNVLSRK